MWRLSASRKITRIKSSWQAQPFIFTRIAHMPCGATATVFDDELEMNFVDTRGVDAADSL
jgi:hypothetical protein